MFPVSQLISDKSKSYDCPPFQTVTSFYRTLPMTIGNGSIRLRHTRVICDSLWNRNVCPPLKESGMKESGMKDLADLIQINYSHIQDRIKAACLRAGRSSDSVTFIAVTKYACLEWVNALIALGCEHLAESRTPQLEERATQLSDQIHWHFIGPLQRNKVRRTIQYSSLIHSVDSLKLLMTIDRIASESNLRPRVLIELNLAGESNKKGFSRSELLETWSTLCEADHVEIAGLMTMAPHTDDPEQARPVFRELAQLREELQQMSPADVTLSELSMGMSGDFEVAIEEGATLVRVGSALYAGLDSEG